MPAYRISYLRKDMKIPCHAIKFAHTEKDAIECLADGSERKGYRIVKSKFSIPITITNIKEL